MLRFSHNLFNQNVNVRHSGDFVIILASPFSFVICPFSPKLVLITYFPVDTAAFKNIISNMACGYDFDVFFFRVFLLQYLQL